MFNWGSNLLSNIGNGISSGASNLKNGVSQAASSTANNIAWGAGKLKNGVSQAASSTASNIAWGAGKLKSAASQATSAVANKLFSAPPQELAQGNQVVSALSNDPDAIFTLEHVESLYDILDFIITNSGPLSLSLNDKNVCQTLFTKIENILNIDNPAAKQKAVEALETEHLAGQLNPFYAIVHNIASNQSGSVDFSKCKNYGKNLSDNLNFWNSLYLIGSGIANGSLPYIGLGAAMGLPTLVDPNNGLNIGAGLKSLVTCNETLSNANTTLQELNKAIKEKRHNATKRLCRDLKPLLKTLIAEKDKIFSSQPLSKREQKILQNLLISLKDPLSTDLPQAVNEAERLIRNYYDKKGATFLNKGYDAVSGLLKRGENLVNMIKGNASDDDEDEEPNPSAEGSFASYLIKGANLINYAKNWGMISDKQAASLCTTIAAGIEQAMGHLDDSAAHMAAKQLLVPIMNELNGKDGSKKVDLSRLGRLLEQAADAFQRNGIKLKANFNGYALPGTGIDTDEEINAEKAWQNNVEDLEDAIGKPPAISDNQDWKTLAFEEKDKLIANTTNFLMTKIIYEQICGLKPLSENFYFRLLSESMENVTGEDGKTRRLLSQDILEKKFFQELESKGIDGIKLLTAKFVFYVMGSVMNKLIADASTAYFEEFFKYIEGQKREQFHSLRNELFDNFTRYLMILGGAYNAVATKTNTLRISHIDGTVTPAAPTQLMKEMVMAELEKPEANLGFKTDELYKGFIDIALEKTTGSGIKAAFYFGTLKLVLWLIEKATGTSSQENVRSLIDTATGSLRDTEGYAYALNSAIGDQLDILWASLHTTIKQSQGNIDTLINEIARAKKANLAAEVPEEKRAEIQQKIDAFPDSDLRNKLEEKLEQILSATVRGEVDQARSDFLALLPSTPELSEGQREQLTSLIKNFLEILQKSNCGSVDELKNLIEGKLLKENAIQGIDHLAIDYVIPQINSIVATAMQALINEKQLQQIIYNSAKIINDSFEVGQEITKEKKQEAERKIEKRCEQILSFAIDSAIKDSLDFSGKKQQTDTKQNVQMLKERTQEYFANTSENLNELLELAEIDVNDLCSPEIQNKIDLITEESLAYATAQRDFAINVKNAGLGSDNQAEVALRNQNIAAQSKELVKTIKELKARSNGLVNLEASTGHIKEIQELLSKIGRSLYTKTKLTEADFAEAETLLGQLEEQIGSLSPLWKHAAVTQINKEIKHIARTIKELRQKVTLQSLQTEISKELLSIKVTKDAATENAIDQIRQKLYLVEDGHLRAQLEGQLNRIESAKNSTDVLRAKEAFRTLLKTTVTLAVQKATDGKWFFHENCTKINNLIQASGQLEENKPQDESLAICDLIRTAQTQLATLQQWEKENNKQLVYSDFSIGFVKQLQNWVSELPTAAIYKRVRGIMDGGLAFAKREETYRYGVVHHLGLIPYIKRMRAKGL